MERVLTQRSLDATKIAVSVFVRTPGQTVQITLDDQTHEIAPSLTQQPAWTSDDLDPSVPHTMQVINHTRRGFVALDSFIVTSPTSPANPADPDSNQSTASTVTVGGANSTVTLEPTSSPQAVAADQQSNAEPILSGGKLAAVIIACVTVAGLIIGGLLYRYRRVRKRKAASNAYWEWMSARAQAPSQGPAPLSPSDKFDGAETRENV